MAALYASHSLLNLPPCGRNGCVPNNLTNKAVKLSMPCPPLNMHTYCCSSGTSNSMTATYQVVYQNFPCCPASIESSLLRACVITTYCASLMTCSYRSEIRRRPAHLRCLLQFRVTQKPHFGQSYHLSLVSHTYSIYYALLASKTIKVVCAD